MKISEVIESLSELKRVYGDVEVVIEDQIYGHVPAEISVTLERGTYGVLIEPESRAWDYATIDSELV